MSQFGPLASGAGSLVLQYANQIIDDYSICPQMDRDEFAADLNALSYHSLNQVAVKKAIRLALARVNECKVHKNFLLASKLNRFSSSHNSELPTDKVRRRTNA